MKTSRREEGSEISVQRRYVVAAIVDTVLSLIGCYVLLAVVLAVYRSPEFVNGAFWAYGVAVMVVLLFRDPGVGRITRRVVKIRYEPPVRLWQYPVKNGVLSLAVGLWLLTHDIYEMFVGGPAKGPVWLDYAQIFVPLALFVVDSYFSVGLRLARVVPQREA